VKHFSIDAADRIAAAGLSAQRRRRIERRRGRAVLRPLNGLRKNAAMGQDGHAFIASAETSRNSFSVVPLAA
jgi:hypothetical protein